MIAEWCSDKDVVQLEGLRGGAESGLLCGTVTLEDSAVLRLMWRCDCRKCAQFCLAGAAELSLPQTADGRRQTAGRLAATVTEPATANPDESPSTHFRGSTGSDSIGSSPT